MEISDDTTQSLHERLPILILTIDEQDGARRQNAARETGKLGLPAAFVQGYSADDPAASTDYCTVRNLLLSRRSLTAGEIAVHAGHRKMWNELTRCGYDFALILEDDVLIHDAGLLMRSIVDCLAHPGEWEIVKFFDYKPKQIRKIKFLRDTRLVTYKYPASGAVCYLISRDAAKRLLSRRRFFRPVDEDFSWNWELGLDIWSVDANLVSEIADDLGGSLLERDRMASRRNRRTGRALWDIFLQGYKQVRARMYN